MEYVALEIGRGGPRQPRSTAADLCRNWNHRLGEAHAGLRLRPGFGGTGNYLLSSHEMLAVSDVTRTLHEQLAAKFVVFVTTDFVSWVRQLKLALSKSNAPKVSVSRRPTPGAVIDMNPVGEIAPVLPTPSPPKDLEAWTSSEFAVRRVRGAWKNDLLRADGRTLDPERREGTWGALAQAMQRAYGSDWTARALSTLEGLSRRVQSGEAITVPRAPAGTEQAASGEPQIVDVRHGVSTLLRLAARGHKISGAIEMLLQAYEQQEDPLHLVVQIRRIAESLTKQICDAHGIETKKRKFVDLCRDLTARRVLSDKQDTYLHALRKLGNFAAHEARNEDVQSPDVEAALWMFLALLNEVLPRPATADTIADTSPLQEALADPSLIRLYQELADDDVALAEEGLADYERQVKAADA